MKSLLTRHPYLALITVAILVHGCAAAAIIARYDRLDHFAFLSLDAKEYFQLARNLVEHHTFSQGSAPSSLPPDTWRTPGYPVFLAAIMVIVGTSPIALVVAQQFLAIAGIALFFATAKKWLSVERSLIVAILFLCEPYRLYDSFWLLSTTLFTLLLIAIWWAWSTAMVRKRAGWFVLAGLILGVTILVRPLAIAIPFVLILGLFVLARRETRSATILMTILFAFSCAVLPFAWMVRNHLVAGRLALTHQGGIVLAYFKATEVELWRQDRSADRYIETSLNPENRTAQHIVWDKIDAKLQTRFANLPDSTRQKLKWENLAQGNQTDVDSFAISDALTDIGMGYLIDAPGSSLAVGLLGFCEILTFPLSLAISPPRGVDVNRWRSAIMGAAYLLLTLAVVWRLVRRKTQWTVAYFPLVTIVALLITSTPQIDPRFRIPMLPMLAFLLLLPRHRGSPEVIAALRPVGDIG